MVAFCESKPYEKNFMNAEKIFITKNSITCFSIYIENVMIRWINNFLLSFKNGKLCKNSPKNC